MKLPEKIIEELLATLEGALREEDAPLPVWKEVIMSPDDEHVVIVDLKIVKKETFH